VVGCCAGLSDVLEPSSFTAGASWGLSSATAVRLRPCLCMSADTQARPVERIHLSTSVDEQQAKSHPATPMSAPAVAQDTIAELPMPAKMKKPMKMKKAPRRASVQPQASPSMLGDAAAPRIIPKPSGYKTCARPSLSRSAAAPMTCLSCMVA
jgi:hypothetical protein